jgi:hypothetical protein
VRAIAVRIADKLEQFNGQTYFLMDSSAVEYIDKNGNSHSVKDVLDNTSTDESTHKTTIFENYIDMGKYLLLAKITNANYANNIIKFSCPNYKGANDTGFKYENDMDIYKFELHFNTGSRRETNSYGVTLKQHGLGLYSYPLSNPKNTEPRLEEAIRLYWDYSKGDIYVFLVDIMTAIPHCVLEYTGSGTLLRNNTFVTDDLYNKRDGLNGTWENSKWSSIPYNKLETPPIYELGGDGGSTEGVKTYTSLEALGLTTPITVGEIYNAMSDNTMAIIACEDIANHITDVPMSYGILTIKRKNNSRFSIEYQNSLGGSAVDVKRWIGTLKGTDGTGLYWKKVCTDETKLATLETQVNELFQSVSDGKKSVANAITGKGVTTSTTATFATMATNIGKITNYTASEKQALATAITNKGVSTSSTATFATMATNISKIKGYKEETKYQNVGTSNETTAKAKFSANVLGIKEVIPPSDDSYIISEEMFRIEGKEVYMRVSGEGTWQITALIEA